APRKSFGQQIAQREKVAQRLAHLLALDEQVRAVQPVFDEPLAGRLDRRAFALRDLIFVMGENQILAAEMQVKARAEQRHAHRAALDVPARTALAPGTRPKNLAILRYARLPQRKI